MGTGGRTPQLRRTNFESMTHQQLVALIASASPSGASSLSTKLAQASSTITKIGEDLREYVSGLPWHGEGGDAFRSWGGQTAAATLRLGEYSKGASRWMELVAEAISEAKATMPPVSETTQAQSTLAKARAAYDVAIDPANRNDPDARGLARSAQSDVAAAETRIQAARGEAALRLRKLGQTYEFTAQQVNATTPPTFPPPAMYMAANEWTRPWSHQVLPAQDASSAVGGWSASGAPLSGTPRTPAHAEIASAPRPVGITPSTDVSRAEPPTRMEIDGLTTLPSAPPSPQAAPPATVPQVGRPDTGGVPSGTIPPAFGSGTVKSSAYPPSTTVTRRPSAEGVRPSVFPGQGSLGSGTAGHPPRDSGIFGGRPLPPNAGGPARELPHGKAIGSEGTPARGPMGYNPAAGTGSGGTRSGVARPARRNASETGGIVAGNPQQTGRPNTQSFSPVSSGRGLASSAPTGTHGSAAAWQRGAAASSPVSNSTSQRNGRRSGSRSGHLAEDEATWMQHGRRTVPPVIE
ncbi:hypothetical protein SSIG_04811 [Streptomyces filamentosus NRRL 11379]|uniref:Uncharacterized protein n=1 Tax=Streptomyces filamentosus NRRL 15998 TaxID=457431 RepID=D6AJF6_STRFL|nr:conserved hypothetical protein [Streptomyces filamentosus NRRL 15998]EWS94181.1 hypothetical protein SSIG_04811 [Streptomyces filamentosus NRRL 11379]